MTDLNDPRSYSAFWPEDADWPDEPVLHPDHNVFPVLESGTEAMRKADLLALSVLHFATDPLRIDTWPRWHVTMKLSARFWDPEKKVFYTEVWNESYFTRAPGPEEAMKAPTLLNNLDGNTIIASDFAYVPIDGLRTLSQEN